MAAVQQHGLHFEKMLLESNRFLGAHGAPQSHTSRFDIPAEFDTSRRGLDKMPTSVKTTGRRKAAGSWRHGEVCMADASRIWGTEPFRLVLGIYEQTAAQKRFVELREFEFDEKALGRLRGSLDPESVADIHETLRGFGPGQENAQKARKWVKEAIENELALCADAPLLKLRPKIDSKGQRRLQCAISVEALTTAASSAKTLTGDDAEALAHYGFGIWPLRMASTRRSFAKGEAGAEQAGEAPAEGC